MKPNRTLRLAREALTALATDDLRDVASGVPTVRDLCRTTLPCEATTLTRDAGGNCQWKSDPTLCPDPFVCLTLAPCH